jgi:presenilin-like A22 family membrane protease
MGNVLLKLAALFILTQAIGLAVGSSLIAEIESGQMEQPTVFTENPDDPLNAIVLIGGILFFTVLLLVFMAFFKGAGLFRAFELFVVFSAAIIVFSVFLPGIAFLFAFLLVALRILIPESIAIRNIAAIISVAGVGALIGISLGIVPVLVFLILLSVYDFIAVFKTKHMVRLAKGISGKNLAFTLAIPTEEHQFELGTGDLVLPLVFAVSAMNAASAPYPFSIVPALMVLAASLIGLVFTIKWVSGHIGKALPALPPQAVLMIMAWLASKAIGF